MAPVSLELDTRLLAEDYDRISAQRQFRAGQRLIGELGIERGEKVLDIGAGTGLLAEYVAGTVGPLGAVVGIDPLPLRIEIAQRRAGRNLSFKVGNANDLSEFPEREFDVAYMNAVFHWLPDKRGPLRQVIRVLQKGGRLGISTAPRGNPNPLHQIRKRVMARPPYNQYPRAAGPVAYRVSVEELRELLTDTGFKIGKLETPMRIRPQATPEEFIQFSEASSFGNFLGNLPEELRASAREQIKRELQEAGPQEIPWRGILAIAVKP
jgi:arsenite methyltransferase